jgi:CIC family chloride channel protein
MIKQNLSLQHFRERLAHYDALPQLVILGLLSGIATGLLMILFRLAVELPLTYWLTLPDKFENLTTQEQFLSPIIGSCILILMFLIWSDSAKKIGMVNLFERLAYHQGQIPGRSLVMQFFASSVALISGHSVGREGPAIYLGAACSSLLGQRLRLPNNSLRLLIACGAAAAISAAFNTPLAGIILAMEVILMEYTLIGFTPIIVAAVSADLVVRSILGHASVFDVPLFDIANLAEIPWIMLLGVAVGLCAALFNHLMIQTYRLIKWHIAIRLLLAGVLTGAVATLYPQIMGVGYDTISEALWGRLDLLLLLGLLIAKLIVTPIILGLGVPAGLIGPTLFIGTLVGGIFGVIGHSFTDMDVSHIGLYAMLGMGAMMGAVLNAPLAALTALLELTGNTNIIFPGMIAIVISNLTVRYLFKQPSIFLLSMQAQGLDYRQEPIAQSLSRAAAGSLMERNFTKSQPILDIETAQQLLAEKPRWLFIEGDEEHSNKLMLPNDLQSFLTRQLEQDLSDSSFNLFEIPAERHNIITLSFRATLYEALQKMDEQHINVLSIVSNQGEIMGMLTRAQIEYFYTHKQTL